MILFIDDEKRVMSSHVLELILEGYDVVFETNVDEALDFFQKNLDDIELLVLDIMMPPGETFKNADVEGGLRTGIRLYRIIREHAPNLQVFVFTNVSADDAAEYFRKEPKCWFGQKVDYLPYEFVEEVKRFVRPPAAAPAADAEVRKSAAPRREE